MNTSNLAIAAGVDGASGATPAKPLSLRNFLVNQAANTVIGANWSQGAEEPFPAPLAPTGDEPSESDILPRFSSQNSRLVRQTPPAPLAPELHLENLTQRLAIRRSCCDMLDALEQTAREAGLIEFRAPTIILRLTVATDGWGMAERRFALRRFFWAWVHSGEEAALAELRVTPLRLE